MIRRLLIVLGVIGALYFTIASPLAAILLLIAAGFVVAYEKVSTGKHVPGRKWSIKTLLLIYQWLVVTGATAVIAFRQTAAGLMGTVLVVVTVAATDFTLAVARKSIDRVVDSHLDLLAVWLVGFIAGGSLLIGYQRFTDSFSWKDGAFIIGAAPFMVLLSSYSWHELKRRLGITRYGRFLELEYGLFDSLQSYGVSYVLCGVAAWFWYVVP